MAKNAYVVDSSSNITNGMYPNVYVLPLIVNKLTKQCEKQYKDGIDITINEIEKEQLEGVNFTTSAMLVQDVTTLLDKLSAEYDNVYIFCIPNKLSQGANNIINMILVDYKNVTKVENHTVSFMSNWQIEDVLELEKTNIATEENIKAIAQKYHDHVGAALVVSDLSYLVRGGRINKAKGAIAKLLKINALTSFDRNGVSFVNKFISIKKLPKLCMQYFKKTIGLKENFSNVEKVGVIVPTIIDKKHKIEDIMKILTKDIVEKVKLNPTIGTLPAVISAHVGPSFYAVCFLTKDKNI